MPSAPMCSDSIGILSTRSGLLYSPWFTLSDADEEGLRMNSNGQKEAEKVIRVPASTGWPLVAAFGFTLVFAGLLTHLMVSTLGAITFLAGLIGWFREVLPREAHDSVVPEKEEIIAVQPAPKVRHLEI